MTQRNSFSLHFNRLGRRKVEADFEGGRLISDAGLLLLQQVDVRLGLLDAVDNAILDPRDPAHIVPAQLAMIAQRILAIAAGYEDENDHQDLVFIPPCRLPPNRNRSRTNRWPARQPCAGWRTASRGRR